ncbi:ATP-binding protein [Actinacidiphila oryziradicis]|uniref:ATP-binding protein n=1 Tax=Actinacidiphila oryziradicis TaxID=2571141 RepID=A0A4U0SJV1_9ACTN|nr:ATP-binding protein [Actinacidiphila oryziradicis]TKA10064.1 ATP-binding protein [Actinacidiphila oryziradicis]
MDLNGSQLPYSCTLFMPSAAVAPKLCRDFVRGVLNILGFGHLADAATLCTSELVSNVHQHASGTVHLQFTAERARVRIAVYDGSTVLPKPREAAAHEECGRGLGLVRALSDGCGVIDDRLGVLAKGLWFELDTGRAVA